MRTSILIAIERLTTPQLMANLQLGVHKER